MAHLKALQAERKAEAKEAMEQARRFYELTQAQGKPYQPEAYFTRVPERRESVFSNTEVAREVTRARLVKDADHYYYHRRLPRNPER